MSADDKLNHNISLKQKVGEYVADTYIKDSMAIGLGSGTTAIYAVRKIATMYREKKIQNIVCCSTGPGTQLEAQILGLPCMNMDHPLLTELDVVIDGADEVDINLHVLKGGGGCHLYEKLALYSAKKGIIVVHASKQVHDLAIDFPLAIECIPLAQSRVYTMLQKILPIASISLRKDAKNIGPWITPEGNYIFDVLLSRAVEVNVFEDTINALPGVVENGFFSKKKATIVSIDDEGVIRTLVS